MAGSFIALEGPDGSGKGEQTKILVERLRDELRLPVVTLDFPQYGESFFGEMVGNMLTGKYGDMKNIDPHLASIPFAFDRWEATAKILDAKKEGCIIIANRFTLSNLAHQTARVESSKREEFINFILKMEREVLRIPQPDLYLYLDVPTEISQVLILEKARRAYIKEGGIDQLEADVQHQIEASRLYREFSKRFLNIVRIKCCDEEGKLRSPNSVHSKVWNEVLSHLHHQTKEGGPNIHSKER